VNNRMPEPLPPIDPFPFWQQPLSELEPVPVLEPTPYERDE
jgi:hypothetical protein